jgi:hypothetical protein
MKSLIVAVALLVLATPALAGDIEKYGYASMRCIHLRTGAEGGEVGEAKKYCDAQNRLRKILKARGYCTYGKGGVGKPSKDGKHCYTL